MKNCNIIINDYLEKFLLCQELEHEYQESKNLTKQKFIKKEKELYECNKLNIEKTMFLKCLK